MRTIITVAGLFALSGCAKPWPFIIVMLKYIDSMT